MFFLNCMGASPCAKTTYKAPPPPPTLADLHTDPDDAGAFTPPPPPTGDSPPSADALGPQPAAEDVETCKTLFGACPLEKLKMARDYAELARLLKVFKRVPSVKGDLATKTPDEWYVGNIASTLRGISSVVPARQNAAVAAGVAPDLVRDIEE